MGMTAGMGVIVIMMVVMMIVSVVMVVIVTVRMRAGGIVDMSRIM